MVWRKISRKPLRIVKIKLISIQLKVIVKEFCYEELLIAFQQTEEKKEQLMRASLSQQLHKTIRNYKVKIL